MPTGNTNGEFNNLTARAGIYTYDSITNDTLRRQGSIKARALPYNFRPVGSVGGGALVNASDDGIWWSCTTGDVHGAYALYVRTIYTTASGNLNRYYGFSLRCITTPTS